MSETNIKLLKHEYFAQNKVLSLKNWNQKAWLQMDVLSVHPMWTLMFFFYLNDSWKVNWSHLVLHLNNLRHRLLLWWIWENNLIEVNVIFLTTNSVISINAWITDTRSLFQKAWNYLQKAYNPVLFPFSILPSNSCPLSQTKKNIVNPSSFSGLWVIQHKSLFSASLRFPIWSEYYWK